MKKKEILELTDAEIRVRVSEEKEHLMRMKLNNAISAIEKPSKIRESRRTVARLLTVLREREIQGSQKSAK